MNWYKLSLVVLLGILSLIALCNLAVIWNGALFVMLVPVWAWAAGVWFDWSRR